MNFLFHINRAEKEAKQKEKLLIKQLEKDKREAEKEKKKMERMLLKEKCQSVSETFPPIILFFRMVLHLWYVSVLKKLPGDAIWNCQLDCLYRDAFNVYLHD